MTVLSSTVACALSAIINYSSLTIPVTYNNAAEIPTTLFEQHETLNGRVVKVVHMLAFVFLILDFNAMPSALS